MAEALRARGAIVTFAGSRDRVEARLVPERGYAFDGFAVSGFPRRPGPALLRALGRAAAAPVACSRILARRRPDVVLGAGGYVAGPMVLAARLRGIPAALTEADAHLGLANRLALPFAQRLFLAYPVAGAGRKARVVGRPIPAASRARERGEARRAFGLPDEGPLVLVFGGSQGATTLNETALAAWGDEGPLVLHLCGERDYPAVRERVRRDGYVVLPFVDDFGAALGAADLVVARAGGSVWEVAAAGIPAVLVPYPHATGDHQLENARHFADAGGALVVDDGEARERVAPLVAGLLADPERRGRMGAAMRAAARPDAAERIADELAELAAARR
ncbi:MAG TPA: UDP-N-acetylglucosamine--N-acetylmuramyl-(pentapeptide) pyrophosphoryl-undecaprenol N-acetylglucosamine transferase [Gaiellaceae bacterium]|nr:UDP-N-acetylglucosamine--N-acetylmuramyl-(pentapeptide) pyrophosphoryl-undecaprenol N-acetylglucosamine transferase [Gaiellaceae bacterium]